MICSVKNLIQSFLQPFGLRLARLQDKPREDYGAGVLFSVLKRFGFSPKHIVDIGANHGNWTRTSLQYFPEAQYTLLEPQEELMVHVQDLVAAGRAIRWINAGASDKSGTLPFFPSRRDDSSSFVEASAGSPGSIPIQVWSLDDLLVKYDLPVPELVKIDAEGLIGRSYRERTHSSVKPMCFSWKLVCLARVKIPSRQLSNSWRSTATA